MKNISIPSKQEFQLEFINSVREFIFRMRWRAAHFLNPEMTSNDKETFGFKSSKVAPQVIELKALEDGLYDLTRDLEFRKHNNDFQHKLKADLNMINDENRIFIAADKTTNYYKMDKEKHDDLLHRNITKDYKKANESIIKDVTKEDKAIASKLELDDRIYTTANRESFFTLKDHKDNFMNNPKVRLLNPTKPELGKISKQFIAKIVSTVKVKSGLNQWKNTKSVIDWFGSLDDKKKKSFIQFDICEFYPSISEKLLSDSIKYAEKYVKISSEEKQLIFHARKSYVVSGGCPWTKKQNGNFDVGMGSFDGAEVADLVGLYVLAVSFGSPEAEHWTVQR